MRASKQHDRVTPFYAFTPDPGIRLLYLRVLALPRSPRRKFRLNLNNQPSLAMSRKDGKNTLSLRLKKVNPANATFPRDFLRHSNQSTALHSDLRPILVTRCLHFMDLPSAPFGFPQSSRRQHGRASMHSTEGYGIFSEIHNHPLLETAFAGGKRNYGSRATKFSSHMSLTKLLLTDERKRR